jgi:nicotinamide mononucleotide transporter
MTMDPWLLLELVAVVGNLAYTVLMMLDRRVGWLFGIAASALGMALFWHMDVFAQVGLNAFYVGMGIYGWWQWGQGRDAKLPITTRGLRAQPLLFAVGVAISLVLILALHVMPPLLEQLRGAAPAWLAEQLTAAPAGRHQALDGMVTGFSLLATWMLARKLLENWAYWIATDLAAIVLYLLLGLHFYAALYAVYVVLSVVALFRWTRIWRTGQGGA